jgi:lipopolysaccharide/colanic/teichoic acid biosynthesis glycosyltransferase
VSVPVKPVEEALEETLVERYRAMAHAFEPRPVDVLLRLLDIVLAAALLVVTAPAMVVAAIAVRCTGRPVLYQGARVGKGGALFTMYKFRTLTPDAELRLGAYLGPELTRRTETEVTRVGRVLRAHKLDELPQLFNIVRGEMSFVGPRPIRPVLFAELCQEIPQYWQRLVVPPGLSGFAQLRLTREMSWAEKLVHDFEYIADRSVSLYAHVLAETAWLVVRGHWSSDDVGDR